MVDVAGIGFPLSAFLELGYESYLVTMRLKVKTVTEIQCATYLQMTYLEERKRQLFQPPSEVSFTRS